MERFIKSQFLCQCRIANYCIFAGVLSSFKIHSGGTSKIRIEKNPKPGKSTVGKSAVEDFILIDFSFGYCQEIEVGWG